MTRTLEQAGLYFRMTLPFWALVAIALLGSVTAAETLERLVAYAQAALFVLAFCIDPTPPYSPHLKGKVESAVKYVKHNFFKPRDLETIQEAREALAAWLEKIANARIHGTTGKVPRELYESVEREEMIELPRERYAVITWKQCKVHPDSHVEFERRLYSVPFRLIREQVWLRAESNSVVIYANDKRVATHPRKGARYQTNEAHLPESRRDFRHRERGWWQARATKISPVLGEFVEEIFEAEHVSCQLRTVQSIISYVEQYPIDRIDAACHRARVFGNYSYKGLRKILVEGLDLQPTFPTGIYVHGKLEEPRFARSPDEILGKKEVEHGND